MDKTPKKKRNFLFRYSWVVLVFVIGIIIVKSDEIQALIEQALRKAFDSAIVLFIKDTAEEEFVKSAGPRECEKRLNLIFECAEPLGWYKNQDDPRCGEYKAAKDILPPSIEGYSKDDFVYWFGYCNGSDTQLEAKYGNTNNIHIGKTIDPESDKLEILDCTEDDDELNEKPGVTKVFPPLTRKYAAFGIVSRHKGNYDFFSTEEGEDVRRTRNVVWTVTPKAFGKDLSAITATGANTSFVCTKPMFRKR